MEGTKELGLGLIFTAKFAEVTVAIDGLKSKLDELAKGFTGMAKASEDTKKIGDSAKKAGADLKKAAEDSSAFTNVLKSSAGETTQYQNALKKLTGEAGTSAIRFKDLTGALRGAESAILQTSNTQFKSKSAAEAWANGVDRAKVAHAFLKDELIKVDKQLLSSTTGTKELVRVQENLRKAFSDIGAPANTLIGQLGLQIKTLPELRTKLADLRKEWTLNNSATVAASDSIQKHASIMNQMGKNGDAWASSVNKTAVAQAFLRGETIKVNGEFISYGKSALQVTKELEKMQAPFGTTNKAANDLISSFGTGIKTFDDLKGALTGLANRSKETSGNISTLAKNQKDLLTSYPTLGKSVEYMNDKLAKGNITYAEASSALSALRVKQIENTKSMDASSKAAAVLAEQKDNLARKYKALGPIAQELIGKYGNEIKSIKDVTAALDSQMNIMNNKAKSNASSISAEERLISANGKRSASVEYLNRKIQEGMITQNQAIRLLNTHNDNISKNEQATARAAKEAEKAKAAQDKLNNSLTNAASSAGIAGTFFDKLGHAVKQLTAWMPAALLIGAVTKALTSGVSAVIEYDQALKNLQAITQATDAETAMMGEKILEVSQKTKYSATEIGKAMTTIGQAGFNAAQTMDIITPAAQLAQGALEKMDVTADLITTTLVVFGLKSHEAARAADVLAAAANFSKANLQQLRTAMNYVGPVAKSAGISLEETAAAMMQLFNVGLKASTVGTSFRQLIGAVEAPSKKLKEALHQAGISADQLNPKFEKTKGVVQGFGGSLEVLNKVLKGDLQKALDIFGIRVAGTALALANLGTDGFKLLVEQAGAVGSAAKMAEIQMGGLEVSMTNTANVMKNLAIVVGQGLANSFKTFLNVVRPVIEVLTQLLSLPFVSETVGALALTAAILGLAAAFKWMASGALTGIQTFTTMANTMAQHARLWALTQEAVAAGNASLLAANSTAGASVGVFATLRAAVSAFYAVLMTHPFVMVATALAVLMTGYYAYQKYQADALLASEKSYYQHQKNVEALSDYTGALKNSSSSELEHKTAMDRLLQAYPELVTKIDDTKMSYSEQAVVVDALIAKEKELANAAQIKYFERLASQYNKNKVELDNLRKGVEYFAGGLSFAERRAYEFNNQFKTGYLRQFLSMLNLVKPATEQIGLEMTKSKELTREQEAAMIKLGVTVLQNGQTLSDFAQKSGIAVGELAKRFPTLQKVVEATFRAQEQLKNTGFTNEDAAIVADAIGTMGDAWVTMYSKADSAQQLFIIKTVEAANKEKEAYAKALQEKKMTKEQHDAAVAALDKESLAKVEAYQEQHYQKIAKIVEESYKQKAKAIQDSYKDDLAWNESVAKMKLAVTNATTNSEIAVLRQKDEVEKELNRNQIATIQAEQTAMLELNRRKTEALTNFASNSAYAQETQNKLNAKINSEKLADDIATYQRSYNEYKSQMDKKISEVEKWAEAVRRTQKEIESLESNRLKNIESLEDKIRANKRLAMDEGAKAADIALQLQQKQAEQAILIEKARSEQDKTLSEQYIARARDLQNQIIQIAESATVKKIDQKKAEIAEVHKAELEAIKALDNNGYSDNTYKEKVKRIKDESALKIASLQSEKKYVDDLTATEKLRDDALQKAKTTENQLTDIQKQKLEEVKKEQEAQRQASIAALEGVTKAATALNETLTNLNKQKVEVDTASALAQLKKFAEEVKTVDMQATIAFLGTASSALPLTEKIAEIQTKLKEFTDNVKNLSTSQVTVAFTGSAGGGATPLMEALTLADQKVKELVDKINASKPQVMVEVTQAEGMISKLVGMFLSIAKEWKATVTVYVYGQDAVDRIKSSIDSLHDKTITITTKHVSTGSSSPGYAKGGPIPGEGNTDSYNANLMPGEFVVRKSAVKRYGMAFFHALNNMVAPLPGIMSSIFGRISIPQMVPQVAMAGPQMDPVNMGTLNLQVGNQAYPVQAPINVLNDLSLALRRSRKAGIQ